MQLNSLEQTSENYNRSRKWYTLSENVAPDFQLSREWISLGKKEKGRRRHSIFDLELREIWKAKVCRKRVSSSDYRFVMHFHRRLNNNSWCNHILERGHRGPRVARVFQIKCFRSGWALSCRTRFLVNSQDFPIRPHPDRSIRHRCLHDSFDASPRPNERPRVFSSRFCSEIQWVALVLLLELMAVVDSLKSLPNCLKERTNREKSPS